MGRFMEEEEYLRCRKHPSRHKPVGVCPLCLRDRLIRLCPDCANVRPCACCPTTTTSSSSASSTSSFSLSSPKSGSSSGIGVIGRISNLIESEPSFQRSRSSTSAAFSVLRSKDVSSSSRLLPPLPGDRSNSGRSSFWSVFKKVKRKEEDEEEEEGEEEMKMKTMMRSKSVGIGSESDSGKNQGSSDVRLKGWSWYFPSPIKVFRLSKTSSSSSRVLQERSPLCRG